MECTGSADFGKSWNFCCKYIGKAGKKRRNGRKINLEEIINITENKKKYLELLLLGDEKEEMIDQYNACQSKQAAKQLSSCKLFISKQKAGDQD